MNTKVYQWKTVHRGRYFFLFDWNLIKFSENTDRKAENVVFPETIIWKRQFCKVEFGFVQFLKNKRLLNKYDERNCSSIGLA